MKKLIFILTISFIVFISCKQSDFIETQENYGTVIFDLTGSSNLRSIDSSTGLPKLEDSEMNILVESNGNRTEEKQIGKLDKKQYKKTFLVGSKIKITAVVMTEGSKWKGTVEHIVTSGNNYLNIKLKKAAFSLEPLKFKLSKLGNKGKFELGFFKNGKSINYFFNEEVSGTYTSMNEIPLFCRDQVGRTYVVYNDSSSSSALHFERYTSEGNKDASFVSPSSSFGSQGSVENICSDHKTGNIFYSYKKGGVYDYFVALLKEGESAIKDITPSSFVYNIQSMTVYNNIISIIEKSNDDKLHLYKFNGENKEISIIDTKDLTELLKVKIKDDPSAILSKAKIVDCYMNDKNIYLLYGCNSSYSDYISVGGILKVSYIEERGTLKLGEPIKLVGMKEYTFDDLHIINVKDERKELYGPRRFVGVDEDVLYIADDGVVYGYEAGTPKVRENKNRLVKFNLKSEKISIVEKEDKIETWMPETKSFSKTNFTLFFSRKEEHGNKVAKIKIYDGKKFAKFGTQDVLTVEKPDSMLLYTFDSSGNFYVRDKNTTNVDILIKYYPSEEQDDIVYEKDSNFNNIALKDVDASNPIASLYYDEVKRNLYYTSNGNLYKLDGAEWKKITKGIYDFSSHMAIYDEAIWVYDKDSKSAKKLLIKGLNLEDGGTSVTVPLNTVVSFSIYKGVLYFLYTDRGKKLYASALKIGDVNFKKTEALFTLSPRLSLLNEIRPIGFDKETDELKFFFDEVKEDYDGRIESSVDKYISLKYSDSQLSAKLEDLPSEANATWYENEVAWQGASDAIMLWKKTNQNGVTKYYAVDNVKDSLNSIPSLMSSTTGSTLYTVYDKFCYDQFGNLYVLIEKSPDYYVVRFELTEDKNYNLNHLGSKISDGTLGAKFKVSKQGAGNIFEPENFIMAVYADSATSGTLYYRFFDGTNKIKINTKSISGGKFDNVAERNLLGYGAGEIEAEYTDSGAKIERQFVAMAANKDGLFIAQKELEYVMPANQRYYKNYNIEIRKYLLHNTNYTEPNGKIDIVGSSNNRIPTEMFNDYDITSGLKNANAGWDIYVRETISDMYAYNGVLYALSYKQVGGEAFNTETSGGTKTLRKMSVSGNLLKVGKTTLDFTGGFTPLHSSSAELKESGKFAPRHIIGILPNQLVVASDGYYGFTNEHNKRKAINYNNIYFFNLNGKDQLGVKNEENKNAYFNLEYKEEEEADLSKNWELVN
ncbi:MAG: hypothetical protein ACTTIZ_03575 [Treponema sp.]